jgi:hypothetical protein
MKVKQLADFLQAKKQQFPVSNFRGFFAVELIDFVLLQYAYIFLNYIQTRNVKQICTTMLRLRYALFTPVDTVYYIFAVDELRSKSVQKTIVTKD